jgi:transposase
MNESEYQFYIGLDWATEAHQVALLDRQGKVVAERVIQHSGAAIEDFIEWLLALAGHPAKVAVAIETPRGTLVETLCDRDIPVYSINPKQLDRFRDRHTVAGSKDDRLDAYVLGDSLRTDLHLFRRVKIDDPHIIQLREVSRVDDDLKEELQRLSNRLREQIYRYFPQLLRLCPAAGERWFWELVDLVPTPADARRVRRVRIAQLLKKHRIRRFSAEDVLAELRAQPVHVAPGVGEAARAHIAILLPRLRLVENQRKELAEQIETLLEQVGSKKAEEKEGEEEEEEEKNEHRDAEIILSIPGIGNHVAATMLGEAAQALTDRSYDALRAHSGQAPVTRRSGKRKMVLRRRACNPRLQNAMYHAARVHAQCDPVARALYADLRQRGHSHGRALRTIGDRLLRILIAMLRTGKLYDPSRLSRAPGPAQKAA